MSAEQRVMIVPEGNRFRTAMLREPKSGLSQCCLVTDQGKLLELNHFKLMFSAWLVDNQLLSDGGVYLATPMDQLFMLLPMLDDARAQGGGHVFCAGDQLLDQQDTSKVSSQDAQAVLTAAESHLPLVCDVKDVDGDKYYRLNDDKVLAWLLCKHDQCKAALSVQIHGLDRRSQDAYVVSFLAEYLKPSWAERLASHLGVELTTGAGIKHSMTNSQGPDKRPKLSEDDSSDNKISSQDFLASKQEQAKQKAAQTRAVAKQTALAKQASGSKKISSFFAPKPIR